MWLEKKISKTKQSNILCPKLRLYITGRCALLIEMCSYLKDYQILAKLTAEQNPSENNVIGIPKTRSIGRCDGRLHKPHKS